MLMFYISYGGNGWFFLSIYKLYQRMPTNMSSQTQATPSFGSTMSLVVLKYIGTLFRLKESSPIRRNHEDDTCSMLMALQVTARVVETWDNFRFAGTKPVQLQYILFGCSHNTNLYGMLGLGNKVYLDMMWLL